MTKSGATATMGVTLMSRGDWIDRSLEQPRVGHHARRDYGDQGSHSEAAKRLDQCDKPVKQEIAEVSEQT